MNRGSRALCQAVPGTLLASPWQDRAPIFDVLILTLLRDTNEFPKGAVADPISAQGAARECLGNENGDIEFTRVFTSSGASWRVRSGPGMALRSTFEGTWV